MIWTNIEKHENTVTIRLMNDFNCDITYILEIHHYVKLEKMVHMVIKIER